MKQHKTNAELFAEARRALLGHLSIAVWSLLLVTAVTFLLTELSVSFNFTNKYLGLTANLASRFVTTLFASLFGIGLSSVFLKLLYGQPATIGSLLTVFFENSDNCVRVRFFITAGKFVCLLPLHLFLYIVPTDSLLSYLPVAAGIALVCLIAYTIWSLTFSMSNYLLLDFPGMDAKKILRASSNMMRGNRLRLFMLYLRILPLHLIGLFSFGIANIWVECCQQACITAFYKDLMTVRQHSSAMRTY